MERQHGNNRDFSTLDSYLAAFLNIKGFPPVLVSQGMKIVFLFQSSPELFQTISAYNAGALVPALQLTLAAKMLKSQIISMKKGNESVDGTARPRT